MGVHGEHVLSRNIKHYCGFVLYLCMYKTCPRCFLQQETLPLLLSTGWFQERIRA